MNGNDRNEVQVVSIHPTTLNDVFGDILSIADALQVHKRGEQLVNMMKARLDIVRNTVCNIKGSIDKNRPSVCHLEWLDPLMGSGYWIYECVDIAGGKMIHGTKGGHAQTINTFNNSNDRERGLEALETADVIIVAPCGFSIARSCAELNHIDLHKQQCFQKLKAFETRKVFIADGNLFFNRYECL